MPTAHRATLRRPYAVLLAAAVAIVLVLTITPVRAGVVAPDAQTAVRSIVFPVAGDNVSYTDTFGAPRSGGRSHEGQDIMGPKLEKLIAARNATVHALKNTATPDGSSGNYLILEDPEGWQYWYIHVNNDTPGTDDGANPPKWIFGPGIVRGAQVVAGQLVGYLGDSGNAEWTAPHLHFEIHKPDGTVIDPYESLKVAKRLDHPVDPTTVVPPGSDTPGVVDAGVWGLRNHNSSGAHDLVIDSIGTGAHRYISGDWDGDGDDTPGYIVGNTFYLYNTASPGAADITVGYGKPGDLPVVGDWDGDGRDTVGVRRNNVFYLRNTNTTGVADITLGYGKATDTPVVGDWDADGVDSFGVRRDNAFYLRNSNTTGIADVTLAYGKGTDTPVVGDWNADGMDTFGVRRGSEYYLRNSNTTGIADLTFTYGAATDKPIVGDWDGE